MRPFFDLPAIVRPLLATFAIHHLRIIVVGVVPMAKASICDVPQMLLCIGQHAGNMSVIVFASVK